MGIFKFFRDIGSNLNPYSVNDFRADLLDIEKNIYKLDDNSKDPNTNLKTIYQNNDKNLTVNVKFDHSGKVSDFIFQNLNGEEYATVSLMHGFTYFNVSIESYTIEDKEQIHQLLKNLDAKNLLEEINANINKQQQEKNEFIETQLVTKQLEDNFHINNNISHLDSTTDNDIYFNIVSLLVDKILKNEQLLLSPEYFLSYDFASRKKNLLSYIENNDIDISLESLSNDESLKNKHVTLKMHTPMYFGGEKKMEFGLYVYSQTELRTHPLFNIINQFKIDDLFLNNNTNTNEPTFKVNQSRSFSTVLVESSVNKNKLLNAINGEQFLLDFKQSLLQENKQLDKKIAIKKDDCEQFKLKSKYVIESKIDTLRKNLQSSGIQKNTLS